MPGYKELLAANPEAFAEHEKAVRAEESARAEKAVAEAVAAATAAKPASLAELKQIVPEKMAGRAELILELQEKQATVAQAYSAVIARQQRLVESAAAKAPDAVARLAAGEPPVAVGAGGDQDQDYLGLVRAEMQRLVDKGVPEPEARARAYAKVSRERRDLLDAHNERVAEQRRERAVTQRRRAARPAV